MSPVAMEKILTAKPAYWLPSGFKNYDELLASAVEQAISTSTTKIGTATKERSMVDKNAAETAAPEDLTSWTWGKAFPMELNHALFGSVPLFNRWTGPGIQPQSGNGSLTVKAAGRSFGASERATYDMSDLDRSTMNLVTGESGHIGSEHYMDQWNAWHDGTTFIFPFSDAAVGATTQHTLMLSPKK